MEQLLNILKNHVLAEPGIVAVIAVFFTNIDRLILFALRFFSAETLKAAIDRIDAAAKARVDKDAALPKP